MAKASAKQPEDRYGPASAEPAPSRQLNRRANILNEAARLFAASGYDATSMRDIAAATGMLPGSLYYHFASKEELFAELHDRAVTAIDRAVDRALDGKTDAWTRLESALAAHLAGLLENGNALAIMTPDFPDNRGELNARLIARRRAYEDRFRDLIADLGLPDTIDERLVRLMLMGAVNWSPVWYRTGGAQDPAAIASVFVGILRNGCDPNTDSK